MNKTAMAGNQAGQTGHLEAKLFKAADALRRNIDAAEYKHVVLGLIFLKHISDSFEARRDFTQWRGCLDNK